MTSIYFNQFSAYPLEEVGQYQSPDPLSTPSFGTQSFSCPLLLDTQVHEANDRQEHHHLQGQHQREPSEHMLIAGSDIHLLSLPIASKNKNIAPQSFPDHHNKVEGAHGPTKWMSSKMRFMKKMMGSDQISTGKTRNSMQEVQDYPQTGRGRRSSSSRTNNLPEGVIRMCSDCKTSKTPLWRSGPQGPKSLCNACGIRQRKARRAIAAAALGGTLAPADAPSPLQKLKTLDRDLTVPFKKRFKISTTESTQNVSLNENTIKFSKNLPFHRGFPQDENDAAILLMALSCGLLHS
ncbi:putative transcription factor C2C2-GATA family [Dioscorea sansibarensis]